MLENLRIALRKQKKLVLIFFLTIFLPALAARIRRAEALEFVDRNLRAATPDGRFLWFRRLTRSNDPKLPPKWESWRISPDGGNPQKLELVIPGGGMRLHPDGRQIAYYTGRGRRDLWVMENFLPEKK